MARVPAWAALVCGTWAMGCGLFVETSPPDRSHDGGTDARSGGCLATDDCNDGIACTRDTCADGRCQRSPDDGRCAAGGRCDPAEGCLYDGCTAETCFAEEACQTAECVGDECVRASTCAPGQECCAGACAPAGCEDGVPCTTDFCGPSGCEHAPDDAACDDGNPCTDDECTPDTGCSAVPNAEPCDDGSFCNGPDTCASGRCALHGSNPCLGSSRCSESDDACIGCEGDTDCPLPVLGGWGACGGFTDPCDVTGTQARTMTTYSCVMGTCTPDVRTEIVSCTRSAVTSCGATSCTALSACDYADRCDETATQTRICTDQLCVMGSCQAVSRPDTVSCTRATDGRSCEDGVLCNGRELCLGGRCVPGTSLCPASLTCEPATDSCCGMIRCYALACSSPLECLRFCRDIGCLGGVPCGCKTDGTCGCESTDI